MSRGIPFAFRRLVLACLLAFASLSAWAQPKPAAGPESAAPYVPTPTIIVDEIMKLAGIGPRDFVIDLGSGDGRLVVTAVSRFGARGGYGVDIDEALVKIANGNAASAGVADRVRFETRDLFATSVSEASVVTLYLLPSSVPKLEGKLLAELPAGARVVSHDYPFPRWRPERVVELDVPEKAAISGTTHTALYLYVVPARIGGAWDVKVASHPSVRVTFRQDAEGARGEARVGDRAADLAGVTVRGDAVTFTLPAGTAGAKAAALRGRVHVDTMQGTTSVGDAWSASRVSP